MSLDNIRIGVVGLGYVGLPLAVEFGKVYETTGYDISLKRISELNQFNDKTLEISKREIRSSKKLSFTNLLSDIGNCNYYIITVPTPVNKQNDPDLSYLIKATRSIAKVINKGDIVIYESTVYPGATEDVCVKIIERISNLKFNQDFYCGYSPERINPGDKVHTISKIKKIVSGSNIKILNKVDRLYKKIIKAGTYKAPSIRVAEAAKVIENTQRDLNVALINELSIIFNKLNIDTHEVLDAAGSKWNFLPFKPGLVGGHCIGVDPYYITHKSINSGYTPKIILSGRALNDSMGKYISQQVKRLMKIKNIKMSNSKILILGMTFKENCSDIRNSKVIDVINSFKKITKYIDVYDPWVNALDSLQNYGIKPIKKIKKNHYDVIILTVAHKKFKIFNKKKLASIGKKINVVYDVKNFLPREIVDGRL